MEKVLNFRETNLPGNGVYIDLAKCLSMVNRQLVRQQGMHRVKKMRIWAFDSAENNPLPFEVSVSGAARNWPTTAAMKKVHTLWQEQQDRAYDAVGSDDIKARWSDFKVMLDEQHRQDGDITPLTGVSAGGSRDSFHTGEWDYSKIVYEWDNAGAIVLSEPMLHIVGPDNGATNKGIVEQFNHICIKPEEGPDLPTNIGNNIYTLGHESYGETTEEIIENLNVENDSPPYSSAFLPGASGNGDELYQYHWAAAPATQANVVTIPAFDCPNGLMNVRFDELNGPNFSVWIQIFYDSVRDY